MKQNKSIELSIVGDKMLQKNFDYRDNVFTTPKTEELISLKYEPTDKSYLKIVIPEERISKLLLIIDASSPIEPTIEIDVMTNAKVEIFIVNKSEKMKINQSFDIGKDARVDLVLANFSDDVVGKYTINLSEEGAHGELKVISLGHQQNKQMMDITFNHKAKNTFGIVNGVAVVNDHAKVAISTISHIEQGMKNSNAFQNMKGIILSDNAVMEINPVLLIDEYDVKAGHGATIGKVDEESLYYIMSRGLSRKEAENMIVRGFITPIVEMIKVEELKKEIWKSIEKRV